MKGVEHSTPRGWNTAHPGDGTQHPLGMEPCRVFVRCTGDSEKKQQETKNKRDLIEFCQSKSPTASCLLLLNPYRAFLLPSGGNSSTRSAQFTTPYPKNHYTYFDKVPHGLAVAERCMGHRSKHFLGSTKERRTLIGPRGYLNRQHPKVARGTLRTTGPGVCMVGTFSRVWTNPSWLPILFVIS